MLNDLVEALEDAGLAFAHYAWSKAPQGDYGTYAEDNGNDLVCDEHHVEKGTDCYLNYFTRDASGAPRITIETILNELRIPWYLNSVQYENDTGYIHFEWGFSVYGEVQI
jgi:hypothetical protein